MLLAAVATFLLTLDRSPGTIRIAGVPYVVPIVLVILVAGTYLLDRTRFGRHVYAVGGNREAARRAGINVVRIRATVFVISSALAAIGAIIYSSKVGSVSPELRRRQHAAVRRRRGGDRRDVAVRRPRPGQQRRHRWCGARDGQQRPRACSASRRRWSSWSTASSCSSRRASTCCPGADRPSPAGEASCASEHVDTAPARSDLPSVARQCGEPDMGRSGRPARRPGPAGHHRGPARRGPPAQPGGAAAAAARRRARAPGRRWPTELGLNRSTIKAVVDGLAETGVVTEAVPVRRTGAGTAVADGAARPAGRRGALGRRAGRPGGDGGRRARRADPRPAQLEPAPRHPAARER